MPTLQLPQRFKNPPFSGDYYKILGLSPNPTLHAIKKAYRKAFVMYHPDRIQQSPVQPPLSIEEANECFRAIEEIKSILLSGCAEVIQGLGDQDKDITSADDLTPGEQIKSCLRAFIRSASFVDYPPEKSPGTPGYWAYIPGGKNFIEQGTSKYSNCYAIATPQYQVELNGYEWDQPLKVFDKSTQPFTLVYDKKMCDKILTVLAGFIPKENRDQCAKIYGKTVREKQALTATANEALAATADAALAEQTPPYVIVDSKGNNYVDGVRQNPDHSFTIFGRNAKNQPREVTLYQDGEALGYNRNPNLGIVESQFLINKEQIFDHFGFDIAEDLPNHSNRGRLGF